MDSALAQLVAISARDLLATTSRFEPHIPRSHHNPQNALSLLGKLADITTLSLPTSTQSPQPPQRLADDPGEKSALRDRAVLDALLKLRKSQLFSKRSTGIHSSILKSNPR